MLEQGCQKESICGSKLTFYWMNFNFTLIRFWDMGCQNEPTYRRKINFSFAFLIRYRLNVALIRVGTRVSKGIDQQDETKLLGFSNYM